MSTASIYAFVDNRKGVPRDRRIFYVGRTKDTPMQRLRQHLDDYHVNDPDRDVFKYIRNTVGANGWDMVLLRDNVDLAYQYVIERGYHDALVSRGFRLQNAVKPPRSGRGSASGPVSTEEIDEAWAHANVQEGLEALLVAKLDRPPSLVDALLAELKKELLRGRGLHATSELAAKNKLLQQRNGDLNKLVKELTERARVVEQMNALLTSNVADLRGVLATDGAAGRCGTCPPLREQNKTLKVRVADLEAHVARFKAERAARAAELVRVEEFNNVDVKKTKVRCDGCGKNITKSNISQHKKRTRCMNK